MHSRLSFIKAFLIQSKKSGLAMPSSASLIQNTVLEECYVANHGESSSVIYNLILSKSKRWLLWCDESIETNICDKMIKQA